LTSAIAGGGLGWSLGAGVGLAKASRSTPATRTRAAIWGVAVAMIVLGAVAASFEGSLVGPGGLRRNSLEWLRIATLADFALVALTLVIASGAGPGREPTPYIGTWARRIGAFGTALGCLAAPLVVVGALETRTTVRTGIQQQASERTADSLASAAAEYHERHGDYPADLETLLAFGGHVEPGSFVIGATPVPNGFCVQVGTDVGQGFGASPYFTTVVHPRPEKAKSWTGLEGWVGSSCRSDPRSTGS
jgi:hypothetical protein